MSRAAAIGFAAIVGAALFLAWQARDRGPLVAEADNTSLLEAIGTEIKAGNAALTPTKTPYLTSTPTRTPKPATETPQPTYGPDATQEVGWYVVPAWTETPVQALTVEAVGLPQCAEVTPRPYADQPCRVDEP